MLFTQLCSSSDGQKDAIVITLERHSLKKGCILFLFLDVRESPSLFIYRRVKIHIMAWGIVIRNSLWDLYYHYLIGASELLLAICQNFCSMRTAFKMHLKSEMHLKDRHFPQLFGFRYLSLTSDILLTTFEALFFKNILQRLQSSIFKTHVFPQREIIGIYLHLFIHES